MLFFRLGIDFVRVTTRSSYPGRMKKLPALEERGGILEFRVLNFILASG